VVLLTPKAKAIFARYAGQNKAGYLLPIYKREGMTERQKRTRRKNLSDRWGTSLRLVGLRIGIPEEQMFIYNARHSFATICKDEGADVMRIMELLGHSDVRITAGYLQDFKKEVLDAVALMALE
jgi:integrase/recombinase XerD